MCEGSGISVRGPCCGQNTSNSPGFLSKTLCPPLLNCVPSVDHFPPHEIVGEFACLCIHSCAVEQWTRWQVLDKPHPCSNHPCRLKGRVDQTASLAAERRTHSIRTLPQQGPPPPSNCPFRDPGDALTDEPSNTASPLVAPGVENASAMQSWQSSQSYREHPRVLGWTRFPSRWARCTTGWTARPQLKRPPRRRKPLKRRRVCRLGPKF